MTTRRDREALYGWVYENNQWGRSPIGAQYYSDSPPELTEEYRAYVSRFIRKRGVTSIADLGCGDAEIVKGIAVPDGVTYVGLDIHTRLIEYDRRNCQRSGWRFDVADLVEDPLPEADLCLVSTVLYLMSFADAAAVLDKLGVYRWVLVTDGQADIPNYERRNIDKPTGKYTPRDLFGNGFYLELPPFDLELEVVLETLLPSGEIMRTVLLEPRDGQLVKRSADGEG